MTHFNNGFICLFLCLLMLTALWVMPVDLHAQQGITAQHPKNQMVLITPSMLAQPEQYVLHLDKTWDPAPVVVSLYTDTGLKVGEHRVDLATATDRIAFDVIIDETTTLATGYYYYRIEQAALPFARLQADDVRFTNIARTHLPPDSTLPGYAEFADVDGDEDPDIVLGFSDPTSFNLPRLFINAGDGQFSDETMQHLPPGFLVVNDLAVLDVDLDGDLDVFFAAEDPTTALESGDRLYLNDGTGHFSDASAGLPSLLFLTRSVDWGFINEDAFPDLVVSGLFLSDLLPTQTALSVLINNGAGGFVDQSAQYLPQTLYGTLDAVLADVNGDERADILLANREEEFRDAQNNLLLTLSGQNALLIQNDQGRYVDETALRMPVVDNPSKVARIADVNNDDAPDLYVINLGSFLGSGILHELYLNDGNGAFEDAANRLPSEDLVNINDVVFEDFDGNGFVDMYLVNTVLGDGAPDVLSFNENGFFTPVVESLPGIVDFGLSATTADMDNDSDLDIFVSTGEGTAGIARLDKLLEHNGAMATAVEPIPVPEGGFVLSQNRPNPFHASTTISYSLARPGFVTVRLYDSWGRALETLVNTTHNAGAYATDFDATGLASGLYFYTLEIDHWVVETRKMVLVR